MYFLLLAAFAFLQPTTQPRDTQEKLPAVQNERFVRDLHDKNIVDILELYTPRAVVIDTAGKSFKGTSELRERYEQTTSAYDSDIHLTTTHFVRATNVAIEHGTYTETRRSRSDGATQEVRGTYVFLHEKQSDGSWLIAHQKWTEAPLH